MKRLILLFVFGLGVVIVVPFVTTFSQRMPLVAPRKCDCENLDMCIPKNDLPPEPEEPVEDTEENKDKSKDKKKEEKPRPINPQFFNVQPTEYLSGEDMPPIPENGYVNDKEFPGFDQGSGTATDTPDNIAKGQQRSGMPDNFREQRRFLRSRLLLFRASGASPENKAKFNALTTDALSALGELESAYYARDNFLNRRLTELQGSINMKNEVDADRAKLAIKGIDPSKELTGQLKGINDAMANNIGQERALEMMLGKGDGKGMGRFREILEALVVRVGALCGKSQFTPEEILGLSRAAELNHVGTAGQRQALDDCAKKRVDEKCKKFTAGSFNQNYEDRKRALIGLPPECAMFRIVKAKADFGGIQYEATKCADLKEYKSILAGNWKFKISGALSGQGNGSVGADGRGTWAGTARVNIVKITMQGPVEFVSSPGACQLKLTSNMNTGTAPGMPVVSTGGMAGMLPVEVTYEECSP